jgi:hypothetical protein
MSLHEELRAAQRCVDDLARCVSRLEQRLGGALDARRVRGDTDHPQESPASPGAARPEPIRVPDAPHDHRPQAGADDEGTGCHRP